MLNQVRIPGRICVVLAAYYGRIRLIHDPLAQYALNTQLVVRWRRSSVPLVPAFVYERAYYGDTPLIHS